MPHCSRPMISSVVNSITHNPSWPDSTYYTIDAICWCIHLLLLYPLMRSIYGLFKSCCYAIINWQILLRLWNTTFFPFEIEFLRDDLRYSLVASTGLSPVTDQILKTCNLSFLQVTGIKIQNYISIIRPLRNINRLCLLSKRWAINFASMLCQITYANA